MSKFEISPYILYPGAAVALAAVAFSTAYGIDSKINSSYGEGAAKQFVTDSGINTQHSAISTHVAPLSGCPFGYANVRYDLGIFNNGIVTELSVCKGFGKSRVKIVKPEN